MNVKTVLFTSLVAAIGTMPATAYGQVFVVTNDGNGGPSAIAEYETSGAKINDHLITGLSDPAFIAVSGSNLFVTDYAHGRVSEYTTSGALLNASLITGLTLPQSIAASGDKLFIFNNGTIGEYTTSGVTVNAALIKGLNGQGCIAVSGTDLFVVSGGGIGKYTTSGATVNSSLIADVNRPNGIAVLDGNLFVTDLLTAKVAEYTTAGVPVNATFVEGLIGIQGVIASGNDLFIDSSNSHADQILEFTSSGAFVNGIVLSNPTSRFAGAVAVAIIPEPSTWALLAMGAGALLFRRRRR